MLRSLLSSVLRSRSHGSAGVGASRSHGTGGGGVGGQVGRSLFSMLRRR